MKVRVVDGTVNHDGKIFEIGQELTIKEEDFARLAAVVEEVKKR